MNMQEKMCKDLGKNVPIVIVRPSIGEYVEYNLL